MFVGGVMMPFNWSQILVIFSCLIVFATSRPPSLFQHQQFDNDEIIGDRDPQLLNIQRIQKFPFAPRLSPNRIYSPKRSDPWGNILSDDFAPGGGADILGVMNYKGLRG